jgi:hypothetical protein
MLNRRFRLHPLAGTLPGDSRRSETAARTSIMRHLLDGGSSCITTDTVTVARCLAISRAGSHVQYFHKDSTRTNASERGGQEADRAVTTQTMQGR